MTENKIMPIRVVSNVTELGSGSKDGELVKINIETKEYAYEIFLRWDSAEGKWVSSEEI